MSEEAPVQETGVAPDPEAPAQQTETAPAQSHSGGEEVKSKPPPPAAAAAAVAPEFNVVKAGYVQRQGLLFKKWSQLWMTLDEDGASLRWYKADNRTGNDGTLYMSKCADVCDPREGVTTAWPENTEGRCFVVCSPNRAHYIIAESVEDKNDWMAKLTEAKTKFNTTGVGIVSVDLFSVEALKVSISSELERAQGETDRALAAEGTSTEQIGQSLDKTVKDAEKELKKDQTVRQVTSETEQTAQQVETEVKIEATTEQVETEVKIEATTEQVESEVKLEAATEQVESEVKIEATTEQVETEVKIEATTEQVETEVKIEAATEQVETEVKIEAATEQVETEVKIEAAADTTGDTGEAETGGGGEAETGGGGEAETGGDGEAETGGDGEAETGGDGEAGETAAETEAVTQETIEEKQDQSTTEDGKEE